MTTPSSTRPNATPTCIPLQRLPAAVVDIALELPGNQALNAALKPHLSEQGIVPLLVQEQLVVTAERRVDFAVLVQVRRDGPGAVVLVEKEDHAFANVDEDADLATASGSCC